MLDPLREAYGKPIRVNSGYRCPQLNAAIGGARNSHHMSGCAADITGGSVRENKILFDLILELGLPFTQLIDEKRLTWVHVSYDENELKKQVLYL